VVGAGKDTRQARACAWISSMSERPRSARPRRLADWLNPTGAKKVHSLVDKVYKRKNLELAWLRVRSNGGAGGVDGQNLADFEGVLNEQLDRLGQELRTDTYRPLPVRRHLIPKAGQPGKFRPLGIPMVRAYCTPYQKLWEWVSCR
jgi:RNA-directed DNA polymerase